MATGLPTPRPVREVNAGSGTSFPVEIAQSLEPVILRGFVESWPVVSAAAAGEVALHDYLNSFNQGAIVPVSVGSPALNGRIFYNDDFTGPNAERGNAALSEVLQRVTSTVGNPSPPLIYLASMEVDECLPGFRAENDVDFGEADPLASIWLGTKTRIAAHNDLPLNLACVAAGRRTFTLFPPDQGRNLYVGPFELTPAGRPISFVDFDEPDLTQYPRFETALSAAQVAEMSAGDALFIPSMWWHHVEAPAGFNVLINYWWRTVPDFFGTPQDVLNHAMVTLRDLPPAEKKIWQDVFDHYVFGDGDGVTEHIPDHIRGILSPIDSAMAARVKRYLAGKLSR